MRLFYEQTLGLSVVHEWNRGKHDKGVMFQVGSAVLELLSPESKYHPLAGSGISLEVPNVHAVWQELKDSTKIIFPLRDNAWGDTSFCIADPEGFEITFYTKQEERL